MRKEQSAEIKAGIFVLISAVVVIVAIIVLGQRTQLFASRYTLVATFRNTAGLIPGAAVRAAGVTAGTVRGIEIVRGPEKTGVVKVVMDISADYQRWITADSKASVRMIGALGDKYIEITLGSLDRPPLASGAELAAEESTDFYEIAEQARQALQRANTIGQVVGDTLSDLEKGGVVENLRVASESLAKLLENAESGPSLLHSMVYDEKLVKMLDDLQAAATALRNTTATVQSGKGPLGEIIYGKDLSKTIKDLSEAAASARAVLKQVELGDGAAHALIYSKEERESLARFASAVEKLDAVMTEIREGKGTLGLLIADPALWESLKRLLGAAEESRLLRFAIERATKPDKKE